MLRKLLTSPIYRAQSSLRYSSSDNRISDPAEEVSLNVYQEASEETLEELNERFDSILESKYDLGADVSLNNGVLTVVVDGENTYVINKQTPNRQLWLSSPLSGPMRFDLVGGNWIEKRSNTELKKLLSEELSQLLNTQVKCY